MESYYIILKITLVLRLFTPVIDKVATVIDGYRKTNCQKRELDHKINTDWIDRATDENKSLSNRLQILKFIGRKPPNRRLGKWAERCHRELTDDLESIEERNLMAENLLIEHLNEENFPSMCNKAPEYYPNG